MRWNNNGKSAVSHLDLLWLLDTILVTMETIKTWSSVMMLNMRIEWWLQQKSWGYITDNQIPSETFCNN